MGPPGEERTKPKGRKTTVKSPPPKKMPPPKKAVETAKKEARKDPQRGSKKGKPKERPGNRNPQPGKVQTAVQPFCKQRPLKTPK